VHDVAEARPRFTVAFQARVTLRGEVEVLPAWSVFPLLPVGVDGTVVLEASQERVKGAPFEGAKPRIGEALQDLVAVGGLVGDGGEDDQFKDASKPLGGPLVVGLHEVRQYRYLDRYTI
jgi:hypothetical protein